MPFEPNAPPVAHRLRATAVRDRRRLSIAARRRGRPPEDISKALKKRGFKFVGPVIVYAWMQAVGLVNDHAKDCFRWKTVRALEKRT